MWIGIEIELRSNSFQFREICLALAKRFTNLDKCLTGFDNPVIDWRKYNICVMAKDEHYRNTIEFNIYPMSWNFKNLKETQEFIQHLTTICHSSGENLLTIFSDCPEFVWLHIHMFMKWALKLRHNKEILDKMSYFTMSYFQYELWKEFMRKDLGLAQRLELFSDMYRGIKNHTIMRHYDRHSLWDALTRIQSRNWFEWHYGVNFGTGADKVKYSPIIFSALRRNGKRTSIEARYAFNYFAKWNIEVIMRYIKIMEQTDWGKIQIKWNLEALFELSCILVTLNAQHLDKHTYRERCAINEKPTFHLPKETAYLEKFKPELSNTFEPELLLNGKYKKPVFTPLTSDVNNYFNIWAPLTRVSLVPFERINCPTISSNSTLRNLDGTHDIIQLNVLLANTPIESYCIYNSVLFQICLVPENTVSNDIAEAYYLVRAMSSRGRWVIALLNKRLVNDVYNAWDIMSITGLNPIHYFTPRSLAAATAMSWTESALRMHWIQRPQSNSDTLSIQQATEIERRFDSSMEALRNYLTPAYAVHENFHRAESILAAQNYDWEIFGQDDEDDHDGIQEHNVIPYNLGYKKCYNKTHHFVFVNLTWPLEIEWLPMTVKVIKHDELGINLPDWYALISTVPWTVGVAPKYYIIIKWWLSEPLITSMWATQNSISNLKFYTKLKEEWRLPRREQATIAPSNELPPIQSRNNNEFIINEDMDRAARIMNDNSEEVVRGIEEQYTLWVDPYLTSNN